MTDIDAQGQVAHYFSQQVGYLDVTNVVTENTFVTQRDDKEEADAVLCIQFRGSCCKMDTQLVGELAQSDVAVSDFVELDGDSAGRFLRLLHDGLSGVLCSATAVVGVVF